MIKKITIMFLAATFCIFAVGQADAQIFDAIKKVKKEVEKKTNKTEGNRSSDNFGNNSDTGENQSSDSKPPANTDSRLILSATPFAAGDTKSKQTSFTFGQPIYGRVFLPYTYSEIFTKKELASEEYGLQLYIYTVDKSGYQDVIKNYGNAFRIIHPSEYDNKYIDFVLIPDAETSRKYALQSNLKDMGLLYFFYTEEFAGKKIPMTAEIGLLNENGEKTAEASVDFSVDYAKENRKSMKESYDVGVENKNIAAQAALSFKAQAAAASVKNAALPAFFANPPQNAPGYSQTSNAQILQMIRQEYGVSQVYMFRFENNGAEEYGVVKNDLGIPTYMHGYRHFYFIYRDPSDNNCKIGGGHLERTYIGGGKFAAPKLAWSGFLPEKSENYPQDADRRYIVDCAKAGVR